MLVTYLNLILTSDLSVSFLLHFVAEDAAMASVRQPGNKATVFLTYLKQIKGKTLFLLFKSKCLYDNFMVN